ncbi:MAG: hypothetical protein HC915_18905 [Anaerolineae bacterium]|nr:hypothetical protein [Anaerolineae bacterium]
MNEPRGPGWPGRVGFAGADAAGAGGAQPPVGSGDAGRAYHRGFYLAALLVLAGVAVRAIHLTNGVASVRDLDQNGTIWVLLTSGLPALGLTVGLVVAWRYWSWLLAERA